MPRHLELGRRGERLAEAFLVRRKLRILERNYRVSSGEIDLVVQDGNTLVFVEVKTRTSASFAQPTESVGHEKQQRLRRLAERYLADHNCPQCEVRFDVIGIIGQGREPEIEYIKNAF